MREYDHANYDIAFFNMLVAFVFSIAMADKIGLGGATRFQHRQASIVKYG